MPTVLIVDDHPAIRRAIRLLIQAHTSFEVCGEAGDGLEAVSKVEGLNPDIVLLDVVMPRMNGIKAAEAIRRLRPNSKIVVFSLHVPFCREPDVQSDGFVSKISMHEELIPVLNRLLPH